MHFPANHFPVGHFVDGHFPVIDLILPSWQLVPLQHNYKSGVFVLRLHGPKLASGSWIHVRFLTDRSDASCTPSAVYFTARHTEFEVSYRLGDESILNITPTLVNGSRAAPPIPQLIHNVVPSRWVPTTVV